MTAVIMSYQKNYAASYAGSLVFSSSYPQLALWARRISPASLACTHVCLILPLLFINAAIMSQVLSANGLFPNQRHQRNQWQKIFLFRFLCVSAVPPLGLAKGQVLRANGLFSVSVIS